MRVDPSVTCRPRREADNNITPANQIYCPLFHDFVVVLFVVVLSVVVVVCCNKFVDNVSAFEPVVAAVVEIIVAVD